MRPPAKYYAQLSPESRALDKMLYSTLKQIVRGSKQSLLQAVEYPSYIQGIIVLHKHCELSRINRKAQAFK